MAVTISGTSGITNVDGSAGTPAEKGSTSATAGMFFPAANTVAFSTASTEAMRIDSSQNVGIGTTSPSYKFHVAGAGNSTPGYFYTPSGQCAVRIETAANDKAVTEYYTNGNGNWRVGPGQTTAGAFEIYSVTASATRALIDSSGNWYMNSGYGSSAVAYGCRAWVNFNGTGTVAIRASGNVSSITDNGGVGNYTINFTTAMPDTNYNFVGGARSYTDNTYQFTVNTRLSSTKTTSALQIYTGAFDANYDLPEVNVSIFR